MKELAAHMWLCAGDTGSGRGRCTSTATMECAICGSQVCVHHACPLWRDHYGKPDFVYSEIGRGR